MVWIALPAAIAAWTAGGASAGASAVPSWRSLALPGGARGPAGSAVVVVGVVVLPGDPVPPVWAAAGAARASAHALLSPATTRRRLRLGVARIKQFSFAGL